MVGGAGGAGGFGGLGTSTSGITFVSAPIGVDAFSITTSVKQ